MHADNVGMKVGDTIKVSGKEFKVSGLIAYVNYSTLHEKKTDMMFDAIKFDVAMVTKEGFERLNKSIHYTYAWKYEDEPADDIEQKENQMTFWRRWCHRLWQLAMKWRTTHRATQIRQSILPRTIWLRQGHGRSAFRHSYCDNRIHFCSDHKQYDSK